ncbi:MAG: TatD family hydrolase [bacterium]|nr:TatD family hydrolase [bacterium]
MIDSHAHILSEYYEDIDSLIKELKSKKILKVINCASGFKDIDEILNLSKKYNGFLYPAIGIHPENVNDLDNIEKLEDLIKNNKIIAIGEIGLDYYWNKDNKELQKELFIRQLDLAEKYNLPIIVHIRDSIGDCYDILKTRKLKGIIHCYSGSYEMAINFIKLGYKLGIGGVLTFKNSKLRELIEKIGINDLVLETDSPYLSPEPFRGKQNNPYNVYYVLNKIFEITGIDKNKILEVTNNNITSIFDI